MPSLINATFWSSIQRFGGLVISFVSNVLLARLLCPEDYGVVGLIMVFIGIADVLIDGGLGNALIQKKTLTKDDISTVFTSNLVVSLFLFITIFLSAPFISAYVHVDKFALFLRVEAIMILLRALYVVHFSLITREMDFQKLARISLTVNTSSTILAVTMAYFGCGVWSLIMKNLSLDLFALLSYIMLYRVNISLYINKNSFKQLLGYGFFVAIANLLESLYTNLLSFILGKHFSIKDLGYYTQAYSLEQIPVYSITSILNDVFFPFLSKEQDDTDKIKADIRRALRVMSFFIYPLMFFLICFAKPIIILLYSEKWLPAVPFFQILCTIGFTNFIYHLNRSILKAVDKTKVLFKTQVLVCITGLSFIFMTIPIGIYAVVIMVAINSLLGSLIVLYFSSKYLQLNMFTQFREVLLNFLLAAMTGLLSYRLFSGFDLNVMVLIPLAFLFYVMVYVAVHYLLKSSSLIMVMSVVQKYYSKNK